MNNPDKPYKVYELISGVELPRLIGEFPERNQAITYATCIDPKHYGKRVVVNGECVAFGG
jgi:hypothetical protein